MTPEADRRPWAVLLAAGESRRLGQAKQLVDIAKEPLVRRAARALAGAVGHRLICVVGARADDVINALGAVQLMAVLNREWSLGMGSSIAAGVRALPDLAPAVLLATCDQYELEVHHYHAMIDAWAASPDQVAVATYAGAAGIPAIFPRRCFEALAALATDQGARAIWRREDTLTEVPLPAAAIDLDDESDLERLGNRHTP